jgi:hypothetical protein
VRVADLGQRLARVARGVLLVGRAALDVAEQRIARPTAVGTTERIDRGARHLGRRAAGLLDRGQRPGAQPALVGAERLRPLQRARLDLDVGIAQAGLEHAQPARVAQHGREIDPGLRAGAQVEPPQGLHALGALRRRAGQHVLDQPPRVVREQPRPPADPCSPAPSAGSRRSRARSPGRRSSRGR